MNNILKLSFTDFFKEIEKLSNEEILNLFLNYDFSKREYPDLRDKVIYILKYKDIIIKLLYNNQSFIYYLNIYYGLNNLNLDSNILIDLINNYLNNKDLVKLFFHLLPSDIKLNILRSNNYSLKTISDFGVIFSNTVLDYLFLESIRFNTISIYDYNEIKYLIESYNIPSSYLTEKKFLKKITNIYNIKDYRLLIKTFSKKYSPLIIEVKRKEYYDKEINSYDLNTKMLKRFNDFYQEYLKMPLITKENILLLIDKYFICLNTYDPIKNILLNYCLNKDKTKLKGFLELESNIKITDMIIDYHFEEIVYNIFIDIKRLVKFQETEGRTLSDEDIEFYQMLLNLDELSYLDKVKVHDKLKKINVMEKYYDDYKKAKDKNIDLIKSSMLNLDKLKKFYRFDISNKLQVPVYVLESLPFCCLVKSLEIPKSEILKPSNLISRVDGASYSLDGSSKLKTFYDPRVNYNIIYADFPKEQLLHIYPVDSYSHYKRGSGSIATTRVFELTLPDKLLEWGMDHNEIIIAQHNANSYDELNANLSNPIPMGIYCYDAITENDIESSRKTGLPIVVVKTKSYPTPNNKNKLDEYKTICIYGYQKEYDYLTLVNEDDLFKRRKLK